MSIANAARTAYEQAVRCHPKNPTGRINLGNILFEDGSSKFVVTPNTPIRQIWISAQATSFKLEWSEAQAAFVLPKTGEALLPLTQRLLRDTPEFPFGV